MGARRGLRRKKPQRCLRVPTCSRLCPLPSSGPEPSGKGSLRCPDWLPSAWPCYLGCMWSKSWPCPGRPVLLLVRDVLPSSTRCPWPCCPPPDLVSPSPATLCPRPALALPLVFFAFLQTRQATKVLNPTRVPKASPPATTMPSSGTSTRVARSPAGHSLVRFQAGRAPQL